MSDEISIAFANLLDLLNKNKPNDRSEQDRIIAIVITDVQKSQAFYEFHKK